MGRSTLERVIADRQREARRAVAGELHRCRLERGLSVRAVCRGAGIDPAHLSRIEAGERAPSQDTLVAIAAAMGCRVSTRIYATDGPSVRDHIQVRLIEALLRVLHARWTARLEVGVHRPARGVIDVLLRDRMTSDALRAKATACSSASSISCVGPARRPTACRRRVGGPSGTCSAPPASDGCSSSGRAERRMTSCERCPRPSTRPIRPIALRRTPPSRPATSRGLATPLSGVSLTARTRD